MQMRQPPRVIPPALLKDVKQVEFVGYVANPKHKRGMPPGEATAAVAALRNMRQQPKQASISPAVAAQNRSAQHFLAVGSSCFGSCFGHALVSCGCVSGVLQQCSGLLLFCSL